jgi:hypothetical protein
MPFGTRGGIRLRHYFSHDGDYELRAFLNKESLTPTEGVRFFRTRVKMTAGAHTVIVTFPDEFAAREGPVSMWLDQAAARSVDRWTCWAQRFVPPSISVWMGVVRSCSRLQA